MSSIRSTKRKTIFCLLKENIGYFILFTRVFIFRKETWRMPSVRWIKPLLMRIVIGLRGDYAINTYLTVKARYP